MNATVDCREQFQEKCAAVFRPKLRNAGFDRFLEVEYVIAGYGYTLGKSVALALLDDGFAGEGTQLSVHIVGGRTARAWASPYDPEGKARQ
ncbi:glycine cleavage T C-terminal barrel domain-containing protein [Mesorhizobium sp.]|uniref:glycine cleavage T C-terminal barrel domain-containing protein n=1 Tax=Mesorhizobium sp. TaxID=1871066 RepID=UPI0025C4FD46|nr:glycine cleavage T C-terminal barrel domain-containing protein [Mesorhizobium sp.]